MVGEAGSSTRPTSAQTRSTLPPPSTASTPATAGRRCRKSPQSRRGWAPAPRRALERHRLRHILAHPAARDRPSTPKDDRAGRMANYRAEERSLVLLREPPVWSHVLRWLNMGGRQLVRVADLAGADDRASSTGRSDQPLSSADQTRPASSFFPGLIRRPPAFQTPVRIRVRMLPRPRGDALGPRAVWQDTSGHAPRPGSVGRLAAFRAASARNWE